MSAPCRCKSESTVSLSPHTMRYPRPHSASASRSPCPRLPDFTIFSALTLLARFSSNVVEKCIRVADPEVRKTLVAEVLHRSRLEKLLRDSYGNYVIQTILDYCEVAQRMLVSQSSPTLQCFCPLPSPTNGVALASPGCGAPSRSLTLAVAHRNHPAHPPFDPQHTLRQAYSIQARP